MRISLLSQNYPGYPRSADTRSRCLLLFIETMNTRLDHSNDISDSDVHASRRNLRLQG